MHTNLARDLSNSLEVNTDTHDSCDFGCANNSFSSFPNIPLKYNQNECSECILAPIYISQANDIQIIFENSLEKVTYTLYGQPIWAIFLHGKIDSLDTTKGILQLLDESNKPLQIELDLKSTLFYSKLNNFSLEPGALISVICRVLHVVSERDAYIRFKAEKINNITKDNLISWKKIVFGWYNDIKYKSRGIC